METVADFIFLGSKITADGDCSHEIKMLAPWKERYDQPRKKEERKKVKSLSCAWFFVTPWTVACTKLLHPWDFLGKKIFLEWVAIYDQPKQHIKKQRYYFANKGPSSPGYGFSSGHVWMWELDYKES